ncbi:MAG: hypothetical protein OEV87_11375 [Phycisphaerae bacterium]|nr:hypothetical protein [Phycisphaerae bacterium]
MKTALKIIGLLLSVLGVVRLEWLAWEAISLSFIWCGTAQLQRKAEADLYFVMAAIVGVCLAKCWKKKSALDSIVRIAILSFLAAMAIYWFFESFFNYRWVAGW